MSTLRVLMTDKDNKTFPAIQVACMYGPKAKALGHDRVRVEKLDGALVSEFTIQHLEAFMHRHGLKAQYQRQLRRDRGDYEVLHRIYPGWSKETD